MVAEVADPEDEAERARIERDCQESVSNATGVLMDALVQVPRRTLPRTTSGKIQRLEARNRWAAGEYA